MTARRDLYSVSQIADMLAFRAADLAYELLPNGKRDGPEWCVGSVAGEPGRSLKVHVGAGHRAGVWSDFSDSGANGDALDLVAAVLFRGDKGDAVQWAKQWLGLADGDPDKLKTYRRAVAARASVEARGDEDRARIRETARRMFAGAKLAGIAGTPAEAYLAGRAIDLRALGRAPGALAFSPACWNRERKAKQNAMLAAITLDGAIVAVHRTYLTPAGDKDRELDDPKLTLGTYRGGFIPLWRPQGSARWSALWAADAAPVEVVVAEGVETALSVAVADPSRHVLAAVSLSNMAALLLPPCARSVIVAADRDVKADPLKQRKIDAAKARALAHLQQSGRIVRVALPPPPHKDFNDWLMALAAGAAARVDEGAAA